MISSSKNLNMKCAVVASRIGDITHIWLKIRQLKMAELFIVQMYHIKNKN